MIMKHTIFILINLNTKLSETLVYYLPKSNCKICNFKYMLSHLIILNPELSLDMFSKFVLL